MNKKGIGWVILGIVVILVVIFGIVAIVAFNRMRESAVDFDFFSALTNYGILLIAGIVIVIIIIVAILLMRR